MAAAGLDVHLHPLVPASTLHGKATHKPESGSRRSSSTFRTTSCDSGALVGAQPVEGSRKYMQRQDWQSKINLYNPKDNPI